MSAELDYLDTSAFVKTVVAEPESYALSRWLAESPGQVSCALVRVEAVRAVRPNGAGAVARARELVEALTLIRLDDELLEAAAEIPLPVRSLDAIHLAAARSLGEALGTIVTYDERMIAAAAGLGLRVASPR